MKLICFKVPKEIYDFLKQKPNTSEYIRQLIRNDMNGNMPLTEEKIKQIIVEALNERGYQPKTNIDLTKQIDSILNM